MKQTNCFTTTTEIHGNSINLLRGYFSKARAKYYAGRGLTTTMINGHPVDITHLHIKEWIDCIRNGGTPSCNIERAFEEGVTTLMAHKSYVEKRRVEWDAVNRKIV